MSPGSLSSRVNEPPDHEGSGIDIHCRIAWLIEVRVPKIPDSGPKKKLLDATEHLVVEKGFDLVSVRDITGACEANVAAVNYHFGNREGLMDLIALHVIDPLNEERIKALEIIERASGEKPPSIEDLLAAYITPLFATAARLEMEIHFFLKLAGRVLVRSDADLFPSLANDRAALSDRFLESILKSLPKSRTGELRAAWQFFENGLGQSLVALSADCDAAEQSVHWITFGARGLGSPKEKATQPKKGDNQGMLFDL